MTTATQLASALAALSSIAHPQYGLGFNKLRGIARRELASQQLQAIVTKAQLTNSEGALANWKPLASGDALRSIPGLADCIASVAELPGLCGWPDCECKGKAAPPTTTDHRAHARGLAECDALASIVQAQGGAA